MFCQNCGAQLRDEAKFCDKCGTALQSAVRIPQPTPEPVQPILPLTPEPVQVPVQPAPAEVPQKPKKKKSPIAIAAVICLVLIAALVIGLVSPAIFGKETVYVLTKSTRYDEDGIEVERYEYEYDEYAQLLQTEQYYIELVEKYDPELDVTYWDHDEDSKMAVYFSKDYEYDDYGNCVYSKYEDRYNYKYTYEYDYSYDDDGIVEAYTQSKPEYDGLMDSDYEVSTEDGLITKIVLKTEDYTRIYAEYEYDDEGRLTQEFSFRPDQSFLNEYEYDGDLLTRVERSYGRATTTTSGKLETDWFGSIVFDLEYDDKDRLIQILAEDNDGEKLWKRTFEYDKKGYPTAMKHTYYTDEGADVYKEKYTCDKYGNIIEMENSDSERVEYEYEKLKVTKQRAAYYHRRLGAQCGEYFADSLLLNTWQNLPVYNTIPNPLWDLKWATFFLRTN